MSRLRRFAALTAALLASGPTAANAKEIPAFARRYRISCAVCHAPAPRLTPAGEVFAANGFRFSPGEEPRDTIGTGDPLLLLQRSPALAARLDAYITGLTKRRAGEVAADPQAPWVVKLLSGGHVTKSVSYYMYFLLSERGEVGGLEDAYVQFSDVARSGISVIVGQFQVSDPLMKRELRLHYEDYQPYRVRVGLGRPDLTYDRGVMAAFSPWKGGDVTVELVSGQGLRAASDRRQFDRDNFVNPAVRITQDVGPLRVGAFGYLGTERLAGVDNRTVIWGPDAGVPIGRFGELQLQYLRRTDSDPFFATCTPATPCPAGAGGRAEVHAGLAELVVWPRGTTGRVFGTALLNWVEADAPVVSLRLGEQQDAPGYLTRYRAASVGAHYLAARNLRLLAELGWDVDQTRARLTGGIVTAF